MFGSFPSCLCPLSTWSTCWWVATCRAKTLPGCNGQEPMLPQEKKMLVSMSRVKEQVMVGTHPVRVLPICHYLSQKQPLMRKTHLQGPTIKGAPWAKAHPDPNINDMFIPNHQWLFGTFFLLGMELLGQKPTLTPRQLFLQKSVCLCPDQSQWLFEIFPSGCAHSTTWPIMTCIWWGRATYYSKTWK